MEIGTKNGYCFVLQNLLKNDLVYFDMEITYLLTEHNPKKIKDDNIKIPDSYIKYKEFDCDEVTLTSNDNLNKEKIDFVSFFEYTKNIIIFPSLLENNNVGSLKTEFAPIKISYTSVENHHFLNYQKYLDFFNNNVVEIYEYKLTGNEYVETYNDGTEIVYSEFDINQLNTSSIFDNVKIDFCVGLDRYFYEVDKLLKSNKNINIYNNLKW